VRRATSCSLRSASIVFKVAMVNHDNRKLLFQLFHQEPNKDRLAASTWEWRKLAEVRRKIPVWFSAEAWPFQADSQSL
jgi:hypothetical protein